MTDEEEAATLRSLAERIIAGEFKVVTVALISEDDGIETFHSGGSTQALGLVTYHRDRISRRLQESD